MATKLRDLIRNVRACKTAAEERAMVQKEKALIRESFMANENEYRPRNVAKLLFISMLGHDTDFGQMECLKLITANTYTEKRIGYLGLTQLFNEKSEVLMMATNRIRIDLNNQSNYIVSLALMALSEICTAEMCRDLASEVLKLLTSGTSYIKKKAALASTRIVRKVPEKLDDFVEKLELLLEDRHHGVLIASLQLLHTVVSINPDTRQRFNKFVSPMVRILKSLVTTYSAEYDISGISDPFLQVEILKFFRTQCTANQQLSEEVSDILAQVTTNTTSNKNTGNAVLYESVKTIMTIESASTLKTLGINILGKFLANKDANSKYISLFMLQKVLKHDIQSVQKYKSTIIECLKENDSSIKTLALDLLYMISNESNVKPIVKELLNQLLNLAEDSDFIQELTNKICAIVDKHAPSRRWYVDTMIKVLILAGNFVSEESTSSLIHLVGGTPELQSYAVHKLYFSLQENLNQEGLARATIYCLGDFGQLLVQGNATAIDNSPITINEQEVIDLFEKVLDKQNQTDTTKEYALSALIKLYAKFKEGQQKITSLIKIQTSSTSIEVQKRAYEYIRLLEMEWDLDRKGICEQIPAAKNFKSIYANKPIGDVELDEYPPEATKSTTPSNASQTQPTAIASQMNDSPTKKDNLIDFDEIMGLGAPKQSVTQAKSEPNGEISLIGDMFGIQTPAVSQQQQQQQTQASDPFNLLNLYGSSVQQQPQANLLYNFNQPNQNAQQQYSSNLQGVQALGQAQNQLGGQPQMTFQQQVVQQQVVQQQGVQAQPTIQSQTLNFKAFDDNVLEIVLSAVKESEDSTNITATFNNKSTSLISEIVFQVAVLKYLKLQLNPMNSNRINPQSFNQVHQQLKIKNTMQGQKAIVMKLKIIYNVNGQQISKECTVNQYPTSY